MSGPGRRDQAAQEALARRLDLGDRQDLPHPSVPPALYRLFRPADLVVRLALAVPQLPSPLFRPEARQIPAGLAAPAGPCGPATPCGPRRSLGPFEHAASKKAQRSRSQETGTNAVLRGCDFSSVFRRASAMDLSDTFRRHAQECRRMATSTRDAADKATWSQMAKRWLACAEYHEDEQSALGTRAESRHRKIHVGLRLPLAS